MTVKFKFTYYHVNLFQITNEISKLFEPMQKTPKISASRTFFLITEHFNLQFQSLNMYWYKKNLNQCNEQHVKYIYILYISQKV